MALQRRMWLVLHGFLNGVHGSVLSGTAHAVRITLPRRFPKEFEHGMPVVLVRSTGTGSIKSMLLNPSLKSGFSMGLQGLEKYAERKLAGPQHEPKKWRAAGQHVPWPEERSLVCWGDEPIGRPMSAWSLSPRALS